VPTTCRLERPKPIFARPSLPSALERQKRRPQLLMRLVASPVELFARVIYPNCAIYAL